MRGKYTIVEVRSQLLAPVFVVSVARAHTHREEPPPCTQANPHLPSARDLMGYYIHATDGDLGHVEDFLVDESTWARPQGADPARMDRPRELGRFEGSARGFLRITP